MARVFRQAVIRTLIDDGFVPLFSHADIHIVLDVARACARGGARCFEFTLRGDRAYRVFDDLAQSIRADEVDLMLGAGSIIDPYTAALVIESGADFVVGPSLRADVSQFYNRQEIAYVPGCATPTEIAHAQELGAKLVKLFPADAVGGPRFVRSVRGPRPRTALIATGGVLPTRESLQEWFQSGVVAVGIGSKLITSDLIKRRAWGRLEHTVRNVLTWIREIRSSNERVG